MKLAAMERLAVCLGNHNVWAVSDWGVLYGGELERFPEAGDEVKEARRRWAEEAMEGLSDEEVEKEMQAWIEWRAWQRYLMLGIVDGL